MYIAKSLYLGVLTFTGEYGKNGLPFLHTCLKIVDGFISYELFVKLTDKHLYIRLDSCHPAYSEYNIQSGLSDFSFKCFFFAEKRDLDLEDLKNHLVKRGYPVGDVSSQIEKNKLSSERRY